MNEHAGQNNKEQEDTGQKSTIQNNDATTQNNQDTIHLLQECDSGCKMAEESINQVLGYAKDQKLGDLLVKYREKHEELENTAEELLLQDGMEGKDPGIMASSFSWLSTEMKMTLKNNNNQISKIMMDGCNMGIKSISEYKNKYKEASAEAKDLAESIVEVEEEFVKELEKFL